MTARRNLFTYLILALIIYALAVYGFTRNGFRPNLPSSAPFAGNINITLNNQNGSPETGTATLQSTGDGTQTLVTLKMANFPSVPQPAHIHIGACPKPGDIKYPLSDVVDGQSVTTLNVSLEALKAMEPLAINVHQSAPQADLFVSCAEVKL